MKRILIIYLFITTFAHSAEIKVEKLKNDIFLITVQGQINSEDGSRFFETTKNLPKAVVILDSPGGSVLSGLEIGRKIRASSFYTAVPSQTLCASSCALIWLAGIKRFAEEDSFVGFHAAFIYKNGKPVETGTGNALIGSYLNQLGLSDNAIIFITNAPPEGIARINKNLGRQYGIDYASLTEVSSETTTNRNLKPTIVPETADTIVRKFYQALSIADGDTASSLVIPEKRGIGPFNEKNISNFFGNMKVPLSVSNIIRLNENLFQVNYSYTFSKTQCNAVATVETQNLYGNFYVKKIKSNC
jgi:hypothetical protein